MGTQLDVPIDIVFLLSSFPQGLEPVAVREGNIAAPLQAMHSGGSICELLLAEEDILLL